MTEITRILSALEQGDPGAAEQLLPLVYDELRKLAAARLAHENADHTLQATALVHEAYLRLAGPGQEAKTWDGRGHFFAAAAEAMRRILVESARRRKRLKRGGEIQRVSLEDAQVAAPGPREDLLELDAALTRLAEVDRTAAELIQLRYFAGLSLAEAADALDISTRTADRLWAYARAWLYHEMYGSDH